MLCLNKDSELKFNDETLYNVRKEYNLHKPGEMEKVVNILDEWVKQQNHFTKKDFPKDVLERIIIMCKGSIERAKKRLDNICTFRTLMPKQFTYCDINKDFESFGKILQQSILPRMTSDDSRLYMLRNTGQQFEPDFLFTYLQSMILFLEYIRTHDYAKSYIVIIDYRQTNLMELASKLYLGELRQGMSVLTEGYGLRLKALHILSNSKIIDVIVKIFKQVMSAKLGKRIQVHKTLDELHSCVPKEVLPVEYGGQEKPLSELNDDWFKIFGSEEFKKSFKEMSEARVDESKRPTDKFNEEYMGMPGTFRSITLD